VSVFTISTTDVDAALNRMAEGDDVSALVDDLLGIEEIDEEIDEDGDEGDEDEDQLDCSECDFSTDYGPHLLSHLDSDHLLRFESVDDYLTEKRVKRMSTSARIEKRKLRKKAGAKRTAAKYAKRIRARRGRALDPARGKRQARLTGQRFGSKAARPKKKLAIRRKRKG
jgi:hypothetical protein